MMLATNYFDNDDLQHKDHAELLLALTSLNAAAHVTVVKYLDVQPWYQLLWARFHMLMIAFAVLLALSMWAAVRRFGPLLLKRMPNRTALADGTHRRQRRLAVEGRRRPGRAARGRAPENAGPRQAPRAWPDAPARGRIAAALAALCNLPEPHVREALYDAAASHPQQFTRQIRTLQTLRNHHER
ncbi:hypothetical protein LP420_03975 [Massilia sp. B-10]|nr:hypothetical protein LP420_03975 [Massilia sp. B-10]